VSDRVPLAEGREAEVFSRGDGVVLKLWRDPGHAWRADREAAALAALRSQGYPAPRLIGATTVDGRPGLLIERVDGADLLTLLGRRPLAVGAVGRAMGHAHAAMHEVPAPDDLPDLHDDVRAHIVDAAPLPDDLRAAVLDVLDGLPRGDRLCHGDLHPGNMLGSWSAPTVIDWPGAARGDPPADVALTSVLHRVATLPPGAPTLVRSLASMGRRPLRVTYLAGYRSRRPLDADALARWEVVRAAARLWAPIPEEHPALLRFIRARLATATA
jgi:aminoglycoside phosphotransferase (APT) family kinase protein